MGGYRNVNDFSNCNGCNCKIVNKPQIAPLEETRQLYLRGSHFHIIEVYTATKVYTLLVPHLLFLCH